jgi:hypothetical protein
MTHPACSCDEAEALLPLVADGTLDAASDPALFAHLADCERCQTSLARHDLVQLALSAAPPRPRRQVLRLALPWAIASAACLVAAVGISIAAWPRPAPPPATQIVRLDSEDGRVRYLIIRDGVSEILDPASLDGPVGSLPEGGSLPAGFHKKR